jgi:hypothetical protein
MKKSTRSVLIVAATLAALGLAVAVYQILSVADNAGGATLLFGDCPQDPTRPPPANLTEDDLARLLPKVADGFRKAVEEGQAYVGLTREEYRRTQADFQGLANPGSSGFTYRGKILCVSAQV